MLVPSQVLLHPSRIVYSVPSLAAMKTIVSLTILSRDADGQMLALSDLFATLYLVRCEMTCDLDMTSLKRIDLLLFTMYT